MSRIGIVFSLLSALFLVVACGDDATGIGDLLPEENSIGWGQAIADSVRDIEYPGGTLFMASCIDIDDDGLAEPGMPWQFYYADQSDTLGILIVMVQYWGIPTTIWEDSTNVPIGDLPDYDDAGPWVTAATDSMGSQYSDWEEYALIVQSNDYPEFPWVLNVAILQFMSPDTTEQLSAIIDADNDDLLAIITY